VNLIYALCPDDSMSMWKKLYFATALLAAVFLAVSLL
jgi:hypothetical protein